MQMVEKAAIFGAGTLISISAPTSHAIARATKHGLTLVSIARRDGAVVFTGPNRVLTMPSIARRSAHAFERPCKHR